MTQGRLQQAIDHYRAQLLAREVMAERALTEAYKGTLKAIQPQLDKLYKQIADKQANGEHIPPSWLYEEKRLETIKLFVSQQIDHYAALARIQTGQLQHYGVTLGTQSAQAMLNASVPSGVNWTFGIPSPHAIADLVGATQAGTPLSDLFNGFGAEAAKNVSQALINGITLGNNPRVVARDVQDALDVPRWRASTIARNEMLRCYKSANTATYRANADTLTGWRWTCAKSSHTCAACIAMDGQIFDLSEDLESHVQCRCVPTPLTKSWDDILGPLGVDTSGIADTRPNIQSGPDWFDQQDESTQRAILGARYDAWSNGDFTLGDVVGHLHDKNWGSSIYVKPLKDLVK